jgi:hypothetical protein
LIGKHCAAKTQAGRLFSIGIGKNVSRHLVCGMARAGRGTSCFVEDGAAESLRKKVIGQLKQLLHQAFDDVSIEWNFPQQNVALDAPLASAPVKTLLGYRSTSADNDTSSVTKWQPNLFPSVNPPIFNKNKYLSYAMFPNGSPKPESVTVKCTTAKGQFEVSLAVSDSEVFLESLRQAQRSLSLRKGAFSIRRSAKDAFRKAFRKARPYNLL